MIGITVTIPIEKYYEMKKAESERDKEVQKIIDDMRSGKRIFHHHRFIGITGVSTENSLLSDEEFEKKYSHLLIDNYHIIGFKIRKRRKS